jgi:hypothetical protein
MDNVIAVSEGATVLLQPRQLRAGGWMADFTLIEEHTFEMVPYYGKNVYATREGAKRAAFKSARRIIVMHGN